MTAESPCPRPSEDQRSLRQPDGRVRLARLLLPGGEEPDPRVTLANERTFLAWIRTAMALLAGGIALEAFAVHVFDETIRKAVAVMLIALGMLVSGGAFVRWVGVERAVREGRPIPLPLIAPVLELGGASGRPRRPVPSAPATRSWSPSSSTGV